MLEPYVMGSSNMTMVDIPESGINRREPRWRATRIKSHIIDWLHKNSKHGWALFSLRIEAPSEENRWHEKTRETVLFYEENEAIIFQLFWGETL